MNAVISIIYHFLGAAFSLSSKDGHIGREVAASIVKTSSLALSFYIFSLTMLREFLIASLCSALSYAVGISSHILALSGTLIRVPSL